MANVRVSGPVVNVAASLVANTFFILGHGGAGVLGPGGGETGLSGVSKFRALRMGSPLKHLGRKAVYGWYLIGRGAG